MSPSALRALQGKFLTPNLRGASADTIRWKVIGFSATEIRLRNARTNAPSSVEIDELELDIMSGNLRVVDK